MTKNKNFWLGMGIALIGVILYKTITLSTKNPELSPDKPSLSLWDLGYVPEKPVKTISDFDLMIIKQQDKTEVQPTAVKVSSFKGQPIILHFWATWCGPCLIELPHYDRFAKNPKIVNLAICIDKSPPNKIREFCQQKDIQNLQIAVDPDSIIARRFLANSLPTSVFINSKGEEIGRITGPIDWNNSQVVSLIEKHLLAN
jgi:thiol-disulfide isomerase/thioredoxin